MQMMFDNCLAGYARIKFARCPLYVERYGIIWQNVTYARKFFLIRMPNYATPAGIILVMNVTEDVTPVENHIVRTR